MIGCAGPFLQGVVDAVGYELIELDRLVFVLMNELSVASPNGRKGLRGQVALLSLMVLDQGDARGANVVFDALELSMGSHQHRQGIHRL